jgi:hypothetical protein
MFEFKIFHLYWEKYTWKEAVSNNFNDFNSDRDFGIYQIYGDHPLYGDDTLLYIGKAERQTFAKRMKGHIDLDACQAGEQYSRIHLGRFCELDDITQKNWEDSIGIVEPILIKSHMPALNGKDVKGFSEYSGNHILVYNWGDKGKLHAEVSDLRCSGYYHDCEKFNLLGYNFPPLGAVRKYLKIC